MKDLLKQKKGITLVALVITIIILLILAMVSISLVLNSGILSKVERGAQQYSDAEISEQEQILRTEYEMAKALGETSGVFDEYALQKQYGVKLGDKVTYDPTKNENGENVAIQSYISYSASSPNLSQHNGRTSGYSSDQTFNVNLTGNEWRVIGIENGQIKLISSIPIRNTENDGYKIKNEKGFFYSIDELNAICSIYGQGKGATGARCLNVEDINNLTGYNPATYETAYEKYGREWSYRFPTREQAMDTATNVSPKGENDTLYMQYKLATDTKWTDITDSKYQSFRLPCSNTINSSHPENLNIKEDYFYYSVLGPLNKTTEDGKNLSDILTKGVGLNSRQHQWLASKCTQCNRYNSNFWVRLLDNNGYVTGSQMFFSNGTNSNSYGNIGYLRPIVYLKSDIKLTGSSKTGWTIQ